MRAAGPVREAEGAALEAGGAGSWIAEGREILARQSAASWQFADFLAGPDAPEDLPDRALAEAFAVSDRKIGQYRAVSRAYPKRIRIRSLTFTHHRLAARLPGDERARILDAAAKEGWSVSRLRSAVRDVSLEGRVRRQAAEIRELRRKLKAVESDPRDLLARFRSRLKAELKVLKENGVRVAALAEELAAPEIVERMHGNARRGAFRDIEGASEAIVEDMRALFVRLDAAREAFRGDG